MLKQLIFIVGFSMVFTIQSVTPLPWELLGLTTYKNNVDEKGEFSFSPNFPKPLQDLEGKKVAIVGYLVPMDVAAKQYALSKNTFKSCFFCGNAGPETVVELKFDTAPGRFETDKYVTATGTLRLNRNGNNLFFTLKNVELN